MFDGATFQGEVYFGGATFVSGFNEVTFLLQALDAPQVLHLDDRHLNEDRVWPDGYTVQPNRADPTRTLVGAKQSEKREQDIPLSDPPADNGLETG